MNWYELISFIWLKRSEVELLSLPPCYSQADLGSCLVSRGMMRRVARCVKQAARVLLPGHCSPTWGTSKAAQDAVGTTNRFWIANPLEFDSVAFGHKPTLQTWGLCWHHLWAETTPRHCALFGKATAGALVSETRMINVFLRFLQNHHIKVFRNRKPLRQTFST